MFIQLQIVAQQRSSNLKPLPNAKGEKERKEKENKTLKEMKKNIFCIELDTDQAILNLLIINYFLY